MGREGPGGQAGRSCVWAAWPPWSDRQDGAVGALERGLKSVKAPRAPSDVSPPGPASDGRREAEGECLPGSSRKGKPQVQCLEPVSVASAERGPRISSRSVRGSEPRTCPCCRPACVFSAKPLSLRSPHEPAPCTVCSWGSCVRRPPGPGPSGQRTPGEAEVACQAVALSRGRGAPVPGLLGEVPWADAGPRLCSVSASPWWPVCRPRCSP